MLTPMSVAELETVLQRLGVPATEHDPDLGIRRMALLEQIKSAAAAAQARQAVAFDEARREQEAAAGVRARERGTGVALEIALARREAPARARRYLGWARILVAELPETLQALHRGTTTEWRAMVVARETGWLSREHRAEVDATLGPKLATMGDRQVENEARKLAETLDPAGKVARLRGIAADRTVTIRPAPDTMTYLTAYLPVAQGVATYAALRAAADTARAAGDERGRGQVMADVLVERATGQASAADVPITLNVVLSDQTLLGAGPGRDDPAAIADYGPVPAAIARDLITRPGSGEGDQAVPIWIRRLYADPGCGRLVSMETAARRFTDAQRQFVKLCDQFCRTPYCNAPIRQIDHVDEAADGGPTSLANAQGLCEACNYAKSAPGFRSVKQPDGTVIVTTPSGQEHRSPPRAAAGSGYSIRCTDTPAPSPPATSDRLHVKSIRQHPEVAATT